MKLFIRISPRNLQCLLILMTDSRTTRAFKHDALFTTTHLMPSAPHKPCPRTDDPPAELPQLHAIVQECLHYTPFRWSRLYKDLAEPLAAEAAILVGMFP